MSEFETRRQQHVRDALALLPAVEAALWWPAERIAVERDIRLRVLIRHAVACSPWHRKRLAGVDLAASGAELLAQIPVMTKADLMGNWDEIVTDPRLTLRQADEHLERAPASGYLLDRLSAVASGGSCGTRSCFVYDWEAFAVTYLRCFGYILRMARPGEPGPVMANVAAGHPAHGTAALNRTFAGPHLKMVKLPVSTPTDDLIAELNRLAPQALGGYPSALHMLAEHALAGRLHIRPARILSYAEPLLPEARSAIQAAWGLPVGNLWGVSEGGAVATPCELSQTHLSEDQSIVEPVDENGRPVPAGARSAKVYLTSLLNLTMPILRYEVTDEVTILDEPCACGWAHRRVADIQGRLDDWFRYGEVRVHPHVFRSALAHHAAVAEYQVRQTPQGADIDIRCLRSIEPAAIAGEVSNQLRCLGIADPVVTVAQVETVERGTGGKLKRFVPLRAGGA